VLKTKSIPKGKLTNKDIEREKISIGIIPVISPGRSLRRKRENLSPTRPTGKKMMIT